MDGRISEILISEEKIKSEIVTMARTLSAEYKDKCPVLVCPLKGSFMFFADIVRAMGIPCTVDFMSVSSYGSGTVSSGKLTIKKDLDSSIKGRHVLIIEDIIDTGNTLFALKKLLLQREPESLKICTFLDKPARRTADIKSDYSCFVIPDKFVIGYGMDVDEQYRYLPYIGVYDPD